MYHFLTSVSFTILLYTLFVSLSILFFIFYYFCCVFINKVV
uniref:Uncharacterized protein n=1 Tax=Myoviridae sp. ct1ba2 TaxID=2827654 RepID=A0A8S5S6N0_9CAUD|nr:MAG TPA: hypothetical protein [Myoviridae sp. ct1ba2]